MNIKASVMLLCCFCSYGAETQPSVKVSPQSIECHYMQQEPQSQQTNTPRCTVRLHATPSKGTLIETTENTAIPPITATDGKGNVMTGQFREWETCYDSKDNCQILVFDFTSLPSGGSLSFDTQIEIPVKPGIQKHEAPSFSTTEKSNLSVAGHNITIEPLEKSSVAPDELVLRITYNAASQVPEIIICDDEGYHLKSNIIDADYDSTTDQTTAVYVQKYTKKTGKFALRTYQPTINIKSTVKFKATIGREH